VLCANLVFKKPNLRAILQICEVIKKKP